MSATLEHQTDNIYLIRITGQLQKSDLDAVQDDFVHHLADAGSIKLLIILENFTGWESATEWDDGGFFYTHGDAIEQIALVGDPRWEAETLAFTGAGLRKAPVRFFSISDESSARAWLAD